jgi:hypothetical protein
VLLPPTTLNSSQVTTLLKQISLTTGAEVVFKSMCFEMHGLEYEVRTAVNMILELDIVKVPIPNLAKVEFVLTENTMRDQAFHHEIRFQVELANEHREFISGKKNGKINKIMQTTNVKMSLAMTRLCSTVSPSCKKSFRLKSPSMSLRHITSA